MLQELQIQNYAIIDELTIRFDPALNIITGETGAGKSILMGALSLILGDRADIGVVLNKDRKCFVEGSFAVQDKPGVMAWLQAQDLDPSTELLIRREIGVNGKSRAFVNDTPVSLAQLQGLTGQLVDLHRQFDTLSLGESGFQLSVMDALAGNDQYLLAYRKLYRDWLEKEKELAALLERKEQDTREFDYHQFLYNELEEAAFRNQELEDLEEELKLQSSAEGIRTALTNVYEQLKGADQPVVQTLRQLLQQLQHFQLPALADIRDRLQAAQIELSDLATEAASRAEDFLHDTLRMDQIQDRLNTGYKLLKKHGLQSTAQLLEFKATLAGKLEAVEQLDERIANLKKTVAQADTKLRELAGQLRAARKKQVAPLEKQVNELLARVGMPNARLKVEMADAAPGPDGADQIDFLFDANKSGQFAPLRKVASGGELSRLMLCIKSLVAGKIDLPTLIFDEIDTGISGEASRQVGLILKELSATRQVICITHQPQIAGKASRHFFVYKEPQGKTIATRVKTLNQEERILAIAQMLSGEKPTPAALENAREMIQL